jgi:hypothetical protein
LIAFKIQIIIVDLLFMHPMPQRLLKMVGMNLHNN